MTYQFKRKRQGGNVLIEFAVSWSVLFALTTGVYQFGYSFYVYNQLATAVANAAQLGANMNYDTGNSSAYTTALTNMVLYGSTTAGSSPVIPNLSASNVNVAMTMSNGIPVALTVSITGYTVDAVFTKFTFNGKPRSSYVYRGHIVCASC
jgi:Flp pilus assembly protein TadG